MVHPLVGYDQGAFRLGQMRDRVLSQHCNIVGSDELRDTVIDLRVDMIGTTSQNDTALTGFFQIFQHLFALDLHIMAGSSQLFPAGFCSSSNLICGKLGKFFRQSICYGTRIPEGHERIAENNLSAANFVYVIFNIFRIRGYDRTVVMVIGILKFIALIEKRRIEDKVNALFDQPGHVTVSQLGRVTL